jgi:amino-acid N-acetyltransferase
MNNMNDSQQHVKWFRDSSPYINAHRGKIFVLHIDGEAMDHPNFDNIVSDIVLLHSLGVQLIVVHGAAPQIERQLSARGMSSEFVNKVRITTPEILPLVQEVVGSLRSDIEARLSMGLVNSPLHGAEMVVISGNFIRAKPLGVIDGVDYHNTGAVRKVNTSAIRQQLDLGVTLLVSPLGYSLSGDIFNTNSAQVATEIAIALGSEKLIYFTDKGLSDDDGNVISELRANDIDDATLDVYAPLRLAKLACLRGVARCHLISYAEDGAALQELFTRDGTGTQVSRVSYEQIRPARAHDVAGIIELITPLEEQGILVRRPRELLESEVNYFTVIERDGMIVSCAALYPFENKGELACLVTHPDYREKNRGELLLDAIEAQARQQGLKSLFVLTTHTTHWFAERGFQPVELEDLPLARQSAYNYQRNSKLLEKHLEKPL